MQFDLDPNKYLIQRNLMGIEYAPAKVREHGLVEAHTWPRVSTGKHDEVFRDSFRVHASKAWSFSSVEFRSATAFTTLVLDLDGLDGYCRGMLKVLEREIMCPNFATWRSGGDRPGGAHFFWCLERPVLRGAGARQRPLKLLARVSEYMGQVVGSDVGYNGVLAHNPMTPDPGQHLKTEWMRKRPYSLDELAEVIPFGWKRPTVPRTAIGRNWMTVLALLKWAGSPVNQHLPVLPAAMSIYPQIMASFPGAGHPFPVSEVEGIAASVERIRSQWKAKGQFGKAGDAERSAWGRRRGLKGGPASGVSRRKGTPLEHDREPWKALGISRRTWYRRRAKRLREDETTAPLFHVAAVA